MPSRTLPLKRPSSQATHSVAPSAATAKTAWPVRTAFPVLGSTVPTNCSLATMVAEDQVAPRSAGRMGGMLRGGIARLGEPIPHRRNVLRPLGVGGDALLVEYEVGRVVAGKRHGLRPGAPSVLRAAGEDRHPRVGAVEGGGARGG